MRVPQRKMFTPFLCEALHFLRASASNHGAESTRHARLKHPVARPLSERPVANPKSAIILAVG